MATTVRGGGSGGGRERRGTSPSTSTSPLVNKSPKPSLTTSSLRDRNNPTMVDRKQVTSSNPNPSYLRATKNSKSNPPSPVSRRPSESSSQKPTPSRRRSLDRPPPATQVHKANQGPPLARETRPLRSSSMSIGRTRAAPSIGAAIAPRTSIRERKADVPQLSKSRSLNRGTLASKPTPNPKMASSSRLGLKKKTSPKSLTSESSNDNYDLIEPLVSDDDMTYTHLGNQSLPEISEMPNCDEELRDPTNLEVVGKPVIEEREYQLEIIDKENHEDKPIMDIQEVTHDQHDEEIVDEEEPSDDDHHHQVEVQSGEKGDQVGESAGDHDDGTHLKSPEVDPIDTCCKENEVEVEVEEEKSDSKEEEKGEEKNVEVEVEKQSVVCSSPHAVVCAPVKVQSAERRENQAYNDVIEQTASRLMGKKNKVLALAGAFETVISYANKN